MASHPFRPHQPAASRRRFISTLALLGGGCALGVPSVARAAAREVRLDYAYYSPASLVLRKFGWLEQALGAETSVRWVLSAGSNRALEFLAGNAVDFGSTAGLAAVLARANGNPIQSIYVYSRPEWTALVVGKDSPLKNVAELKGRKIAATKGTDPYLFLLRALAGAGLSRNDIEHVHLQHADGRTALEQGKVDAWAGLDPHMAAAQLQSGARLLYRNVDFNTYGVLNVSEQFAAREPETVAIVLQQYERARQWIRANAEGTAQLLAQEAKVPLDVAQLQLSRTDFSTALPADVHRLALKAAAPILSSEALVRPGTDVAAVIDKLLVSDLARRAGVA